MEGINTPDRHKGKDSASTYFPEQLACAIIHREKYPKGLVAMGSNEKYPGNLEPQATNPTHVAGERRKVTAKTASLSKNASGQLALDINFHEFEDEAGRIELSSQIEKNAVSIEQSHRKYSKCVDDLNKCMTRMQSVTRQFCNLPVPLPLWVQDGKGAREESENTIQFRAYQEGARTPRKKPAPARGRSTIARNVSGKRR